MTMKQVSKEDFEVLSKYHPAEIRYYADTGTEVTRRKPTRVTVKRDRKPIKRVGKQAAKGGNRANASKFVQLTTKNAGAMRPNTLQYAIYCDATRVLKEDPTKVLKRNELTAKLVARNPNNDKDTQIVPTISALIKNGYLRYTGEASQ